MSVTQLQSQRREYRELISALFAVHRRVVVRGSDGAAGPEFCTCGDVWPCRNEAEAACVLDWPDVFVN